MGMRLNTGASWGTDSSNTEFRTISDKVPNIAIDIKATKRIFACFLLVLLYWPLFHNIAAQMGYWNVAI